MDFIQISWDVYGFPLTFFDFFFEFYRLSMASEGSKPHRGAADSSEGGSAQMQSGTLATRKSPTRRSAKRWQASSDRVSEVFTKRLNLRVSTAWQ